jgi:hypothetical protein
LICVSCHLVRFSELKSELELLGSGSNADLTDDQADALWTLVDKASDSLVSLIPSSVPRDPPDGVGESVLLTFCFVNTQNPNE